MLESEIVLGDCLEILRTLPDESVDLVMCSPPYEDARTYGIDFKLRGEEWVKWAFERFVECVRVSKGLVCWVVEGKTKDFRWSATPALLMADLHRAGIKLRKPPAFYRIGIPGSGGPDWLRNDYEFMVCATHSGRLPWSDNTACGHPPKWAPGGEMSNRLSNGARVNQWGHSIDSGATVTDAGGVVRSKGKRPSHTVVGGRDQWGGTPTASSGEGRHTNGEHKGNREVDRTHTKTMPNGEKVEQGYVVPVLANPGNIIQQKYTAKEVAEIVAEYEKGEMFNGVVGGGVMGSKLAHENEAPYPEWLCDTMIKSFCPPDGIVLDPFCGSGTTLKSALKLGRNALGIDVRPSQVELSGKRVLEVTQTPPIVGVTQ